MTLIAAQAIDFAIFGSLGTLWVAGAFFIYVVWRWVMRYEAENPDIVNRPPVPDPRPARAARPVRHRAASAADVSSVAAHGPSVAG